jgi:hypothetical protein
MHMRLLENAAQARHRDRIALEVFRRSLRRLALDDPLVRRARSDSRICQIEHLRHVSRSNCSRWNDRRRAGKKMCSRI